MLEGSRGYSSFHYVEDLELTGCPLKKIVIGSYVFSLLNTLSIHGGAVERG